MIQKAIITSIDYATGKIKVRIPRFEVAGVSTQFIIESTLCYEPGNYNNYQVNDVVYVGFENYELDKPIILGKLFTGIPEEASNYSYTKALKVLGSSNLSKDTKIGDLSYSDLEYSKKKVDYLLEKVTELIDTINIILPELDNIKNSSGNYQIYTTTNVNDIRDLFGLEAIETDEVEQQYVYNSNNIATEEDIKSLF